MDKLTNIRNLASANAQWVVSSPRDWMRFLNTAARAYRFGFGDQLLIYAQRLDSTACATLDVWNKKMNRWVNRGAKGIALIDNSVYPPKIRYVFDIRDTHAVRNADVPYVWEINAGNAARILEHLTGTYDLNAPATLTDALRQLSGQLTEEYLGDAMDEIDQAVTGSRLANLDNEARQEAFRAVLRSSIFYTLARRCGLNAEQLVAERDFSEIRYFNRMGILSLLGNNVNSLCEAVLMDIGREVRTIDRENFVQPLAKADDIVYDRFNVVMREINNTEQEGQENGEHEADLSSQGGLSVSESGDRADKAGAAGRVRPAAQDLSEGAPDGVVQEHAVDRSAGESSAGDRQDSERADGDADEQAAQVESRAGQGNGSAGLGEAHEQSDGNGRGDRTERIDLLLSEENGDALTEAEAEMASALSLPEMPDAETQIAEIEQRILRH